MCKTNLSAISYPSAICLINKVMKNNFSCLRVQFKISHLRCTLTNISKPYTFPSFYYCFNFIPLVLGDLMNEDKVLEWLLENKSTGDDDDVIEDVTAGLLNSLIDSMDHLAVIFCESVHSNFITWDN